MRARATPISRSRSPGQTDPRLGTLKITVSPTIAGDLGKALDGLIDFPYGCVEQTMSRFMPAVLVGQTVRELGLPAPKRLDKLPEITRDSLDPPRPDAPRRRRMGLVGVRRERSLYDRPRARRSRPRTKRAGVDVDAANPGAAVKWGMGFLEATKSQVEGRPPSATGFTSSYALLRWGERDATGLPQRDRPPGSCRQGQGTHYPTAAELATAVLAYREAGRATGFVSWNGWSRRARVGEETVTWAPEDDAWGGEATALALVALEATRPSDPLLPRVVRGLMSEREGDGWASTRDNRLRARGSHRLSCPHAANSSGTSTATIVVNGQARGSVHPRSPSAADPARTVEIPRDPRLGGVAKVQIRTTGRVYRTVALSGFEVAKPAGGALDRP